MNVQEKLMMGIDGILANGPINIVLLGDSITHGAINGYLDYENVYWNRLKKKLNAFRDFVPVNMINSGVGGSMAKDAVTDMERRVYRYAPDLVIVCFGLNDVNGTLENYIEPLKVIFEKCLSYGAETIFMTPNMLNTYVAEDTAKVHYDYAGVTAGYQNGGRMDTYIYEAVKVAKEMGVTVCDCYSEWKKLSETQDVTMMLANRINHPKAEMHELFAQSLFEAIFAEDEKDVGESSDTMYSEKG